MENNTANCDVQNFSDEICVNLPKIYDTCKDKDCLSDMRVYLSAADQDLIESATNVKARKSKLIWADVSLEEVPFNKGFYGIDLTFYFKTDFEVYNGSCRPTIIEGLSFYCKKVILYGSEGSTTTFSSCKNVQCNANLPIAEVEIVDPIILNTRILNPSCACHYNDPEILNLPQQVSACFADGLSETANRRLVLSLGLFSIVRIIRNVQVMIPSAQFCMPEKECCSPQQEEPCSFFEKLCFPTEEFFPPENKC